LETGTSEWPAKHAELFHSAKAVLAEVVDFVTQKPKHAFFTIAAGLEGLVAENEEELDRVTEFVDRARAKQPKFHYQRNTVYLRFCHAYYHKGAALAELSRSWRFRAIRFSPRAIII